MAAHQGDTGKVHKVKLPSAISVVMWGRRAAAAGATVPLEIFTQYIGNDAEMKIELTDKSGKNHGTFTGRIYGNHFMAPIRIPVDAKEELIASVKLSKHSLNQKSAPMIILPPVEITNVKWDKKEAHRGDVLKLTADVKNVPDGAEGFIEIWEHGEDGAHEFVAKFPVTIKNKKVEAEWEYVYQDDAKDIPTNEEMKKVGKQYGAPSYFFRVRVAEVSSDSGLLEFKDWVEFTVKDVQGKPVANRKYTITFAEGRKENGTLDDSGHAKIESVSPGPYVIEVEGAGRLVGGNE